MKPGQKVQMVVRHWLGYAAVSTVITLIVSRGHMGHCLALNVPVILVTDCCMSSSMSCYRR